jgi:membrane-bound lytic murein transglycosylase C
MYLSGIDNPTSRRYAVITAYNGGAAAYCGSSPAISPGSQYYQQHGAGDVYSTLTNRHPSAESRRYLYKVNTAQKSYRRK